MKKSFTTYTEEDVEKERVDHLIEERVPWLLVGLAGGLLTTYIVSRFESLLNADVRLAFFIPIVVYLSGAVGMQTSTIYVRELAEKKVHFWKYIAKESAIGCGLGALFGLCLGAFALYWLNSTLIAYALGITTLINLTTAPILGVAIPSILYKEHKDPALGAGPVATIIQDLLSLVVYFLVAHIFI